MKDLGFIHSANRLPISKVSKVSFRDLPIDVISEREEFDDNGLLAYVFQGAGFESATEVTLDVSFTTSVKVVTDAVVSPGTGTISSASKPFTGIAIGDKIEILGSTFEDPDKNNGIYEVIEIIDAGKVVVSGLVSDESGLTAYVNISGPIEIPKWKSPLSESEPYFRPLTNYELLVLIEPSWVVDLSVKNVKASVTPEKNGRVEFELEGKNLYLTSAVFIEESEVETFDVLDDRRMSIQVLPALSSSVSLDTIRVLSFSNEVGRTTDLAFSITRRPTSVSGPQLLAQKFITLLTDPSAGNIKGAVPKGVQGTPDLLNFVVSRLSFSVQIVTGIIQRRTSPRARLDEILDRAYIAGASMDGDVIELSIRVVSRNGASATVPVTL